jgi:hypothetical protein
MITVVAPRYFKLITGAFTVEYLRIIATGWLA